MRIGIPTQGKKGLEEQIGAHFGRVPTYTIVNGDEVEVIENNSMHQGGSGYPPELLDQHGVEVMLCANLGRKAVNMFSDMGIEVYVGAKGTVRNALEQYEKGKLNPANQENACGGKHH